MKKVGSLIRQLLPRRDVPLRQNARAQKLLLLLLTPLTAFWLMQLVLGSPPWNMSAGVALANWLCLSALYWIGCAIIGYPDGCMHCLHYRNSRQRSSPEWFSADSTGICRRHWFQCLRCAAHTEQENSGW